jgi:hypothetical protein
MSSDEKMRRAELAAQIRADALKAELELREAHAAQYREMQEQQAAARRILKVYYKDQVLRALRGEPVDEL